MNTVRVAVIAAVAASLFAPAPSAQASELVKLARLIVTGKRTPTMVPAVEPKAVAPQAQAPAPARVEPNPAPAFEVPEADTVAPRLELPRPDRHGGERVGGGPAKGHAG